MPPQVTFSFSWNHAALFERVAAAVVAGLEATGKDAFDTWEQTAPISNDERTRGDLRKMFRAPVEAGEFDISLILHAYSREAKFVELGTWKMDAQSPLRRTAGLVMASVPHNIRAELQGL
jgi:hypothetical protein